MDFENVKTESELKYKLSRRSVWDGVKIQWRNQKRQRFTFHLRAFKDKFILFKGNGYNRWIDNVYRKHQSLVKYIKHNVFDYRKTKKVTVYLTFYENDWITGKFKIRI